MGSGSDRPLPGVSGANTVYFPARRLISGMYSVDEFGDWLGGAGVCVLECALPDPPDGGLGLLDGGFMLPDGGMAVPDAG